MLLRGIPSNPKLPGPKPPVHQVADKMSFGEEKKTPFYTMA